MGQRKRSLVKARRMEGMRKSMGATTGTTGNFVVNGRVSHNIPRAAHHHQSPNSHVLGTQLTILLVLS